MIRLVLAVCEVLVFVVEDIELEVDFQVVETLAEQTDLYVRMNTESRNCKTRLWKVWFDRGSLELMIAQVPRGVGGGVTFVPCVCVHAYAVIPQ